MSVSINSIFTSEISKLTPKFIPEGCKQIGDRGKIAHMQEFLSKEINDLGRRSSVAQGLNKVITSAENFRKSENTLYLIKDAHANGNNGKLIGLLKVGHKSLYIVDDSGNWATLNPLCVLDFYVLEDYQRHGVGKKLFNFMLQDQQKDVEDLAIDKPSDKLKSFLENKYGLKNLIKQRNNFSFTQKHFEMAKACNGSGRITPIASQTSTPPTKQRSTIGDVIHGTDPQKRAQVKTSESPKSSPITPIFTPELEVKKEQTMEEAKMSESPQPEPSVPQVEVKNDRPSTLEVRPLSRTELNVEITPAGSTVAHPLDSLTDRGYFDIKNYHNKLW